jgi:hypothetical protein
MVKVFVPVLLLVGVMILGCKVLKLMMGSKIEVVVGVGYVGIQKVYAISVFLMMCSKNRCLTKTDGYLAMGFQVSGF